MRTSFRPFDESAMRAQMRRLVEASIDRLPDAMRTVYVLRAIAGMTIAETAQSLDVSEAHVRELFPRAKRELRGVLIHEFDAGLEQVFSFAGTRCDRIVAGVLSRLADLLPGKS